ncbi:MAG: hypothetical protein M3065_15280 [Actinomycetota bacterium]|nr:hypothetical protein [Actinomycetota bacterium]
MLALTALGLALPLLLIAIKASGLPPAAFLRRHDTLTNLPSGLSHTVADILLVPLGALIVVVFRLTLGLRLLGPFRSILLAFAFLSTGIWIGLAFFAATIAVLVAVRPLVRSLRLPYFGRVSVMLSFVAMLLIAVTLTGTWLSSASLRGVAHFPIVVLCLVGEAVARSIKKEGVTTGVWRAAMTALAGVIVTGVASIGALRSLLLRDPELMLVGATAIVLVSRFCAWRVLERLNPRSDASPPLRDRARSPSVVGG